MKCSETQLEVSGSQLTERGGTREKGGNGGERPLLRTKTFAVS